ncbi:hypothetical protein MKX01_028733 [Papaver californicum]|nr:hypothetical protein MKX01_028733 [Papaver californicum]
MEFNHVMMQISILDIRNLKKLLTPSNQVSFDHHNSILPSSTSLSPSLSASIIGNNNDILTQLLLYLPRKSLHRFKCVSKQWSSLILDTYFIQKRRNYRKYIRHHRSIQGLFLHKYWLNEYGNNLPEFEFISIDSDVRNDITSSKTLNFANDPGGIQIEQSCNGLLLCSTFGICNNDEEFDSSAGNYYVYNPTTGRYTVLPSSEYRKHGYESCFSVSLAFNPFKSPHYKVICMSKNYKADECQIEIYYSETCAWRLVGYSCSLTNIYGCGVYWNGLLNWHNVHDSLVYFDIDRELIGAMPMPGKTTIKNSLYFGACKGHLYYVEIDCIGWSNFLSIFEMKTDCTGWNVKYHVDIWKLRMLLHLQENIGYSNFENDELKVLLIDGEEGEDEEEEESPKLVFQVRDKVISYDLKDSSLNKVHDIKPVFIRGHLQQCRIFHAYQYIKSFASV